MRGLIEGHPSRLLIGAAVGTGLAARGAVRGGCDFLLALNVAKLRSMGGTSAASILPVRDSNRLVMDFGCSEILPARRDKPVFFGACCFDPRLPLEKLVDDIAQAGFQGVVNFPTSVSYAPAVGARLQAAGVGFEREVELLRRSAEAGLQTLAYAGNPAEAMRMAEIGVDMINLSLGWYTRGFHNLAPAVDTLEAAELARAAFREIRKQRPSIVCLVEGGPIVNPADMFAICQASRSDGYIGGSAVDSAPHEAAVEDAVAAFKTFSALRGPDHDPSRAFLLRRTDAALIGWSKPIVEARAKLRRFARSPGPVLLRGPVGAGKELVARTLAMEAGCKTFTCVPNDGRMEESLFGVIPGPTDRHVSTRMGLLEQDGSTALYIENLAQVPPSLQQRLLSAIETGKMFRFGDSQHRDCSARLILALDGPAEETPPPSLYPPLLQHLATRVIPLPALLERMEDLPLLVRHFLEQLSRGREPIKVGRSLFKPLMSYSWPGNIRELRSVIEQAVASANGHPLEPDHLPPFRPRRVSAGDEREWILGALKRHRFRRSETAQFLGISRKTLFNKMKAYGIAKASDRAKSAEGSPDMPRG
nr:sigma-54-dependent Fis family transcriptional regulator [Sphingomonas sp. Y57]